MYIDINGKIGSSGLRGRSGKRYGLMSAYSDDEKSLILDDGIRVYVRPEPSPITPEQQKASDAAVIAERARKEAESIMTVEDRIEALAEAVESLDAKIQGLPVDTAKEADLKSKRVAMKVVRDKAKRDIAAL